MKQYKARSMKRQALTAALTTALYLGLSVPLLASSPPVANKKVPDPSAAPTAATATATVAKKCMSDLQAFEAKMQKDGNWVREGSLGYGRPVSAYGEELGGSMPRVATGLNTSVTTTHKTSGADDGNKATDATVPAGYLRARPGYDLRALVVASNILARRGHEKECQAVLSTTRELYKDYKADLGNDKTPTARIPAERQQQIASSKPVTGINMSFGANQLIGSSVVSEKNKDLGSVEDIIMDPKTDKIVYLVIGRGGVFGIGEKYVPVPWDDFKMTANRDLLVLDTNKDTMDGAPQIEHGNFSKNGGFSEQGKKIDAYWKAPKS